MSEPCLYLSCPLPEHAVKKLFMSCSPQSNSSLDYFIPNQHWLSPQSNSSLDYFIPNQHWLSPQSNSSLDYFIPNQHWLSPQSNSSLDYFIPNQHWLSPQSNSSLDYFIPNQHWLSPRYYASGIILHNFSKLLAHFQAIFLDFMQNLHNLLIFSDCLLNPGKFCSSFE